LDSGFNPGADSSVWALALQPDGKILLGGWFNTVAGQPRYQIARLNPAGTLDHSFFGEPGQTVQCLSVQPDGKILVGGEIFLSRLNADGTLDNGFQFLSTSIYSLVSQANNKILVGGTGTFYRLNPDGSIDYAFAPQPNDTVFSLALQTDGRILVGGNFTSLAGRVRNHIGRLNNTEPATESLSFDGSSITWLRGGASPEVWRTTFDWSTDGLNWIRAGNGTRISGGWVLSSAAVPQNSAVRARGFAVGGFGNGSNWFLETTQPAVVPVGFDSGQFGLNLIGSAGQTLVLEGSTDLIHWKPLVTNTLGAGPFYFKDPDSADLSGRFYRARGANF